MTPSCPPHYTCQFKPNNPHYWAHWWDGPWGIAVSILMLVALCVIVAIIGYWWHEVHESKRRERLNREERANRLALEEQRTMQLDAAKGNPEMLKLVQEMQR